MSRPDLGLSDSIRCVLSFHPSDVITASPDPLTAPHTRSLERLMCREERGSKTVQGSPVYETFRRAPKGPLGVRSDS